MVGADPSKEKLKQMDFAIAGAGSGFITRMLSQPLDVLKIRFQLQVEPIKKTQISKYQSLLHATRLIIAEEGIKALWKGHVPAQFLSISYGIVQFWTFEMLSREIASHGISQSWSPLVNFTCGSISGGTATLVSFPFDVIRTRLVAQSERNKVYTGFYEAFHLITKNEGFFVLYRGLWPTFLQVVPHAGVSFMCYKIFDRLYKYLINSESTTLSSSLVSGSLAGLCAKTAIYPFDLIKKRLQVQGFEHGRKTFGKTFECKGVTDCMIRIYQTEGAAGYFKGLSPSLIKAVVTSALYFSSYEMILKFIVSVRS